jgi:cysteinyl-tRNA synthetase
MLRKLSDESLLGEVGPGAKRDPLDFPLWRRSAAGEPSWPSRFGPGRPGWHIECSAMSMRHLGEVIDLHGGGTDLIFSHHESERAQSESMTGRTPFARAWMHAGMVRFAGRKMSKSLGNLVVVREALRRAPAAAVRLYLVSHHYRRPWTFEWTGLERMAKFLEKARGVVGDPPRPAAAPPRSPLVREFRQGLEDDLNTAQAFRALRAAVREKDRAGAAWMLAVLAGTAALH